MYDAGAEMEGMMLGPKGFCRRCVLLLFFVLSYD